VKVVSVHAATRAFTRLTCLVLVCATVGVKAASAQQAGTACPTEAGPKTAQTMRCTDGLVIVAEDGAKFTLQGRDPTGHVSSVDLQGKALLLDAPIQPGKSRFRVTTPQAIAAVRGTRWAVDVQGTRTSILVLKGQVAVGRPRGTRQVLLGPGDGVDVDPGADPLVVKRWAQARVDALLARLGQ
jgi:ferric-dicitrate binding protein FerR (iron transport regulator)